MFQSQNPFIDDPEKKISKKIAKKLKKISLQHYLQPKLNEMGQEREKKILVPNSVLTRFGNENSEKYSKKVPKIKKPFSIIIFSQNGTKQAKKVKKKIFQSRILLLPNPTQKITKKKIEKKFKNLKNLIPALFLSETG